MTEKRFVYCFEGIEDKWETIEEYKYTPCTKDGFQDLCEMLNELNDENLRLKRVVDLCMTCEYRGHTETGCLCEKKDCWVDMPSKCEFYKRVTWLK